MMVVRSDKWLFVGECWGNLVFECKAHPDQRVFVKEAKYVDVEHNIVYRLHSTNIDKESTDIPVIRRHFKECLNR